ncbi:hypothetical protein LKI_01750 [Leuconostoc kimchii IMSNU 11154]|uniref:Uncharacterized protein n=1 Tax=Leuconostoc kimchii (strain IMSNU 11154 / KCTC 2386 / IH25) TaxID=762051 RepID=D5T0U4_LEUKI|nr:hypothetical protein LKI_01750 [Leuconostoc kimchii IMSNU 11154]
MRYFKKQLFKEYGILPGDLDNQDYFAFMNMMNAKEPDKRAGDPLEIAKQMGLKLPEEG